MPSAGIIFFDINSKTEEKRIVMYDYIAVTMQI